MTKFICFMTVLTVCFFWAFYGGRKDSALADLLAEFECENIDELKSVLKGNTGGKGADGDSHISSAFTGLIYSITADAATVIDYIGVSPNVEIPASYKGVNVTAIGSRAFYGMAYITQITIPDTVTSFGSSAFTNCTGLTAMTLPDNLSTIGANVFQGCTGLTAINFPDNLQRIESRAFYGCTGLRDVKLPDSLTPCAIWDGTFLNCTGLKSIIIPANLVAVGDYAFGDCLSLTEIFYGGANKTAWNEIVVNIGSGNNALSTATIYYYSETRPTPVAGEKYWYYGADGVPAVWA
ncbi:MAG: leucine-rich repeat domain-containing protein [Christensenellaceae bacterium]|nr:leucine-rich repeat domain-containing protein [Christensenellaceae bacterium]